MLAISEVAADARVLREAAALSAAGHRVHIIGRDGGDDPLPPPGVTVSSVSATSPLRPRPAVGEPRPLPVHLRALRWLLLPEHRGAAFGSWARRALADAEARSFDVVHAHDFTTLALGARLAAARGARLVYDSHELWSGRPRAGRPTPVRNIREARVERRLGALADAVLTVGEGVARRLRARYGWRHVTVVPNCFPQVPATVPLPGSPRGAVYAGRIAPHRDLETIVAAARRLPGLTMTVLGPADRTYLAGFAPGAVEVRGRVAVRDVDPILRRAGLALVTQDGRCENHRMALPNRLYHAVSAGVPVVATDLPELRRVVTAHGIGTLYRAGDPGSLAAAVRAAADRYPRLLAAVAAARPELCWERAAVPLLETYAALDARGGPRR